MTARAKKNKQIQFSINIRGADCTRAYELRIKIQSLSLIKLNLREFSHFCPLLFKPNRCPSRSVGSDVSKSVILITLDSLGSLCFAASLCLYLSGCSGRALSLQSVVPAAWQCKVRFRFNRCTARPLVQHLTSIPISEINKAAPETICFV